MTTWCFRQRGTWWPAASRGLRPAGGGPRHAGGTCRPRRPTPVVLSPASPPSTHHFAVLLDALDVLLIALGLLLLLDARDDAPGSAAGANHILVGHRQQIPLLNRQLLVMHHLRHLLHLTDLHHQRPHTGGTPPEPVPLAHSPARPCDGAATRPHVCAPPAGWRGPDHTGQHLATQGAAPAASHRGVLRCAATSRVHDAGGVGETAICNKAELTISSYRSACSASLQARSAEHGMMVRPVREPTGSRVPPSPSPSAVLVPLLGLRARSSGGRAATWPQSGGKVCKREHGVERLAGERPPPLGGPGPAAGDPQGCAEAPVDAHQVDCLLPINRSLRHGCCVRWATGR